MHNVSEVVLLLDKPLPNLLAITGEACEATDSIGMLSASMDVEHFKEWAVAAVPRSLPGISTFALKQGGKQVAHLNVERQTGEMKLDVKAYPVDFTGVKLHLFVQRVNYNNPRTAFPEQDVPKTGRRRNGPDGRTTRWRTSK